MTGERDRGTSRAAPAAQLAYGFGERPAVRYGVTALCVGMGMGAAIVWENLGHA